MIDYAQLAQSLKDNEAFQSALDGIRSEALEALATVSADDWKALQKYQVTVSVVDAIRANFEQFIRAGKPKAKPGIA